MRVKIMSVSKKIFLLPIVCLSLLSFFTSCSSTKYLKENQYLLKDNKIIPDSNIVDRSEIKAYANQKPNRRILGWPFYISLYNMVDPAKEADRDIKRQKKLTEKNLKRKQKGRKLKENPFYLSRWWRNSVGEAPVIFNSFSIEESKKSMKAYLRNLGYYHALASDSVRYIDKHNVEVDYHFVLNKPYIIEKFDANLSDQRIDSLLKNSKNIKYPDSGELFNSFNLDNIRYDISEELQNEGYYGFGPDQVSFFADTNQYNRKVTIEMRLYQQLEKSDTIQRITKAPIYYFKNISVINYPYNLEFIKEENLKTLTFGKDSIDYKFYDNLKFNPVLVNRRLDIHENGMYRQSEVARSIRAVSSLGIFKSVHFKIQEVDKKTENYTKFLNCEIQLSPATKQSYSIDLEGYTSSGTIGTGLKFTYQHKNLFKRAISLNASINGKLERIPSDLVNSSSVLAYEYGLNSSLKFPNFFSPFRLYKFNNRFFPNTLINFNYTYKDRNDYIRQTMSLGFGYAWSTPKNIRHNLNPVEFYLTEFKSIEYDYLVYLVDKNLYDQYFDHVIPAGNYSIFYTNQEINRIKNFFLVNLKFELAGNLFTLVNKLTNAPKTGSGDLYIQVIEALASQTVPDSLQQEFIEYFRDSLNTYAPSYYTFSNLLYNQYWKTDIDLRYNWVFNKNNSFVLRFFGGLIFPYGNTDFSPVEKQYFMGGSNDLRAWYARSVGPGSYVLDEQTLQLRNYYQHGDIKLLINAELRHGLIWRLKGALFADIGNIWNLNPNESFPNGTFKFNSFYKQIALGAGYGLRLDFTFFVVRFDLAFKLYDPSIDSNNKWVYSQGNYFYKRPILNFGIGYPF
jgi:outer membrane protein assembly factor BamA